MAAWTFCFHTQTPCLESRLHPGNVVFLLSNPPKTLLRQEPAPKLTYTRVAWAVSATYHKYAIVVRAEEALAGCNVAVLMILSTPTLSPQKPAKRIGSVYLLLAKEGRDDAWVKQVDGGGGASPPNRQQLRPIHQGGNETESMHKCI